LPSRSFSGRWKAGIYKTLIHAFQSIFDENKKQGKFFCVDPRYVQRVSASTNMKNQELAPGSRNFTARKLFCEKVLGF